MNGDLHPFLARLAEAGAYQPPTAPTRPVNGAAGHTPPPPAGDPQAARYAVAALDREAGLVAETPEGVRNDQLNKSSFRMGQLVGHGWLTDTAATDTLIHAGMAAGLSYAESERTVLSGLDAGIRAPRTGVELHPAGPPPAYVVPDLPGGGGVTLGGGQISGGSHDVVPDAVTGAEAGEPSTQDTPRPRQLIDGGAYIHQAATAIPALWGDGDEVLWATGEPLIITGPSGVGKTTLGTCVVAGRLGLVPTTLGYPVVPGRKKTLVLAMDRPAQIQRAMARLLRQFPEDVLNERLIVWQGPPPADLGKHPHTLYQLAELADADTVVIDSLKDAAIKLSDEETGQGLSRAMNYCVFNGVQVLAYHHQTKRSGNAQGKPNTLADVYGSSWITAGAGSVILVWGNAGDLVVDLSHLKQPADVVGPLSIGFDHTAGRVFLYDGMSENDKVMDLLRSGPQTAPTIASWLWGEGTDRAAVMRAKRRLDRLVETGTAIKLDDQAPSARRDDGRLLGSTGGRYALAPGRPPVHDPSHATNHADSRPTLDLDVSAGRAQSHDESTGPTVDQWSSNHVDLHAESRETTNQQVAPNHVSSHAESRGLTGPPNHAPKPPFRGGVGGVRAGAHTREGDSTSWDSHDVEGGREIPMSFDQEDD